VYPQRTRRKGGASCSKGPQTVAIDDIVEVAYSDHARPSRGPWPSEAPPTGMLTGMVGEMTFYYGACWHHYRSARR
jgi:hypothetical protein